MPDYEYALDRIQYAAGLATNRDTQLWVQKTIRLCTKQMENFKAVTSAAQMEKDVVELGDDAYVTPPVKAASTEPASRGRVLSAAEQQKQKRLAKQDANRAKQAEELERRQLTVTTEKKEETKKETAIGATPEAKTEGAPKGGKKTTTAAKPPAALDKKKKKPTPKKQTKKQEDDDEALEAALKAAEAAQFKIDEKRKCEQQLAAAKMEEKKKIEAAQSKIDAKRQREQQLPADKMEEKKKIEAEQILRKRGEGHHAMLVALNLQGKDTSRYTEIHHAEILSYLELIFEKNHKDAVHILLALVKNGHELDYAEQKLSNCAQYQSADIQEMYLHVALYLLTHNRAIDVVASFVQRLHGTSYLNEDNPKITYTGVLSLLVQKGIKHVLAKTIINAWIGNDNINMQCNLLTLLTNLVTQGYILPNISEILQHFSKSASNTYIANTLIRIQQELRYYTAKELIRMNKEEADIVSVVTDQYDLLCKFFVDAMKGDDAQKKHHALQVAAIFAKKNRMLTEIESALEITMQDMQSEFFSGAIYALLILVEHNQARDLAKHIVIKLSTSIQEQNASIQTNYLSILVRIWEDCLQEVAQKTVAMYFNSQDFLILSNVCELLSQLIDAKKAPKDAKTIIQVLKKAPFDEIQDMAAKLETKLGESSAAT